MDITDYGGEWVVVNGLWRPAAPVWLSNKNTKVVGVASASQQLLQVSDAVPFSLLASLRKLSANFVVSKSGTTNLATSVVMFMNLPGDLSTGGFYGTGAWGVTTQLVFSAGMVLQLNPTNPNRLTAFTAGQNAAIEQSGSNTSAFPLIMPFFNPTDMVRFVLGITLNGTTDIPSCERLTLIGE